MGGFGGFGVADIGAAVFAPVFWLGLGGGVVSEGWGEREGGVGLTVDFQYSDILGRRDKGGDGGRYVLFGW